MFDFLKANKVEYKDTLIPVWSDFHSGAPSALFPLKQMQLRYTNTEPTAAQRLIHKQFDENIDRIIQLRAGKRIVRIFNGDAVEGVHHNNQQIMSLMMNDHKLIHTELMDYASRRIGETDGDLLYYVAGTDSHAGEAEESLAKDLGAIRYNENRYCHPILKLNINGKRFWFAHQGANPGKDGTGTKGNQLRNKIKQIYNDCLERGVESPDVVVFSHFHHKWHEQIDTRNKTIDGFVLPSWQMKTDWAMRYFPFEVENIGGLILSVTADGRIEWEWSCMEFESTKEIRI